MSLQHRGEYQTVEHNVILADEMHQTGVLILPPFLPASPALRLGIAQLLGVRDVAYRRIKPHVKHLSLGSFNGYGYAPVKVTRHGARLKVHVQPAFALAVHVGAPLLMPLENPLFQPFLIVVQRQIPVLGAFNDGLCARYGAVRMY